MGVEKPVWYEPNEIFNRALLEDRDVWWIHASHLGHPLAPPVSSYRAPFALLMLPKVGCPSHMDWVPQAKTFGF
jgi:hypothetical protein